MLGASFDKQLAARWQRRYKAPSPYLVNKRERRATAQRSSGMPGSSWLRDVLELSASMGNRLRSRGGAGRH